MPTTVNSDIGGGANDYADPFLWEAATDNDLVAADQVQVGRLYGEHTGNLDMAGATTDSTRYRILQAASGQGIGTSDPYAYDGTKGAAITSASTYTAAACFIQEAHSRIDRIQVRTTANTNQPYATNSANRADRCLFQGSSTSRSVGQSTVVAGAVFSACTFINRGSASSGSCLTFYLGGTLQNCTLVTPSDLTDPADAIVINFPDGTAIIRNNVVCGFTSVGTIGTPATCTNNYTDAGSPPSGFSAITYTTSTGAGNAGFENITDGTHDFRIKAASALVGAGTATGAPSTDMAGRSYAGTPSVGAMEGAAGSAPTITVHPVGSAAAVGATAQFSITSGDATSYQWQVSANGGETWANVSGGSGGTTATYTTPTTVAGDNGKKYRCVATNANGSTNSSDAFFHVSGVGLTGRGRGTSRERYPPLIDPQILVRKDPRVCPESGDSCFDDFAAAFKDLYFYSDPPPPPPELERWEWTTRNRPGSGPLSTGKFFIAQRPIITSASNTVVALTGVASTGAVGSLGAAVDKALSGNVGTVSVGTLTASIAAALSGVSAAGSVGSLSPVATVALTGVAGTGAAGNLTAAVSVSLSGVLGTGEVGTVSPTTDTIVALTGVGATGAVGSFGVNVSAPLSGVAATGGVGNLTATVAAALSGAQASGAVGSFGVSVAVPLTGVAGTGAVGEVTPVADGSVGITGVSATGAVGSHGVSVTVALSGVSATASAGSVTAAALAALSGVGATGAVGSFQAFVEGLLSGVAGAGQVGTVTPQVSGGDVTIALTGVSATGQVGNVTPPPASGATGGWPIAAMVAEMRRRAQRERERLKALEEEEEERQRAIARAKSQPAKEKAKASLEKTKLALANQERLLAILTQEIAQALAEEARAAEEAEEREVIELFLEML